MEKIFTLTAGQKIFGVGAHLAQLALLLILTKSFPNQPLKVGKREPRRKSQNSGGQSTLSQGFESGSKI